MKVLELKKVCGNCKYCCYGMRGGKETFSCMKIRGGKNVGLEFDREQMPVSKYRKGCDFFKPNK
jgi:hypothetical protein